MQSEEVLFEIQITLPKRQIISLATTVTLTLLFIFLLSNASCHASSDPRQHNSV